MSTREFGMAAHTYHLDWVSELGITAALAGVGIIGDSIGTTGMRLLAAAGITRGAPRFTIAAIPSEAETHAPASTTAAAELLPGTTDRTGLPTPAPRGAVARPTAPALQPGHSTETPRLLAVMRNLAASPASARGPTAVTTTVDRQGATRRAEAPALAALAAAVGEARVEAGAALLAAEAVVVALAVVVAVIIDRDSVTSLLAREFQKWRQVICIGRS